MKQRSQEKAKNTETALERAGNLETGSLLKMFTVMRQTRSAFQLFCAVKELWWYKHSISGFVRIRRCCEPGTEFLDAKPGKVRASEILRSVKPRHLSSVKDDTTSGDLRSSASLGGGQEPETTGTIYF